MRNEIPAQRVNGPLAVALTPRELKDEKRWAFGVQPAGFANYAWVPHIIRYLAPRGGSGARSTLEFGVF